VVRVRFTIHCLEWVALPEEPFAPGWRGVEYIYPSPEGF
jgi:hypothetical protein